VDVKVQAEMDAEEKAAWIEIESEALGTAKETLATGAA
jgi:hypothetical protein